MEQATVSIDDLFGRLRPENLWGDEWAVVDERPGLVFATKRLSPDFTLMRADYALDLPPPGTSAMLRPEVYFDPRRPTYDEGMLECGVEEALAPGDAVVWFRSPVSTTASILANTAAIGTPQAPSAEVEKIGDRNRMRWITRRDFPEIGPVSLVMAPFSQENGELLEERGVLKAIVAVFTAHEDPGKTRAVQVRMLQRVPDWAIKQMASHFLRKQEWIAGYKVSPVYAEVQEGSSRYVVLGIRKCVRGPPLLPSQGAGAEVTFFSDWMPADPTTFELPWYLRAFLHCVGLEVDIHETLDGRRLVPYQAVVRRGDWERAWAELEKPWRAHKAAYRKLHGGRCAPEIAADVAARFLPHATVAAPNPTRGPGARTRVPVMRTFVHFGDGPPGLALPRNSSEPKLETLAAVEAEEWGAAPLQRKHT